MLDNAVKFTPSGGSISVLLRKIEQKVQIQVIDTGIGMDKNSLAKTFTPFFQADTSATRAYSGTGLGLAISKGIAEAHGGSIKIESEGLGKGCVVTIII